MYHLFYFLHPLHCKITYECDLPSSTVLSMYTNSNCEDCRIQASQFEELSYQYDSVQFRNVDCVSCDCLDNKILPTYVLSDDQVELKKLVGVQSVDALKILLKRFGYESAIEDAPQSTELVKQMKLSDFNHYLIKPWLILFYKSVNEPLLAVMQELALKYRNKLRFGVISKKEIQPKENLFNIRTYPSIYAYHNGLSTKFNKASNINNLSGFIDILIKPVLQEIKLQDYQRLITETKETFYILFYQDKNLSLSNFTKLANAYKFIATIYMSNDLDLMKHINVEFNTRNKKVNNESVAVLVANKHGLQHQLKISNFNYDNVNEWIFHTHYPYLTKVNHENFYRVFHSLKPVILLITSEDNFNDNLEKYSEITHDQKATSDYIFATLDINVMPGFVDTLLPGFNVPGITIYDPKRMLYFTENHPLTQIDFKKYINDLRNKYINNLLMSFPFRKKKSVAKVYFILALILVFL
ncbi:hypothetical protein COBT_001350, partial [Conglomerata obtusa]